MSDTALQLAGSVEPVRGIVGVLGVGIDLVQVARVREVMRRTPRFMERVLSADELIYCQSQARPEEHVAVRFAAKEAVIKIFGSGLFSVNLADIEVARAESGAPFLVLRGGASQRSERLGVRRWLLSLTHTDEVAGAVVVAVGA